MNYLDVLNDEEVVNRYNAIDEINPYPFNHGLKHVKNVCNIMNRLCDILNISGGEKEALLIACALHDIGQVDGREEHGKKSKLFTIDRFGNELETNNYYDEILNAIEKHDNPCDASNTLFCLLVQFCDKMDFTRDRLENNCREKHGYIVYEEINEVEFIYNEKEFGINLLTSDKKDFEDLFFSPDRKFVGKVINAVNALAEKLERNPVIQHNGNTLDNTI